MDGFLRSLLRSLVIKSLIDNIFVERLGFRPVLILVDKLLEGRIIVQQNKTIGIESYNYKRPNHLT